MLTSDTFVYIYIYVYAKIWVQCVDICVENHFPTWMPIQDDIRVDQEQVAMKWMRSSSNKVTT